MEKTTGIQLFMIPIFRILCVCGWKLCELIKFLGRSFFFVVMHELLIQLEQQLGKDMTEQRIERGIKVMTFYVLVRI